METITIVFLLTTAINVIIALKLHSRLSQVTELLDDIDDQIDVADLFEDIEYSESRDAYCKDSNLLEDDQLINLEKRIKDLETGVLDLTDTTHTVLSDMQLSTSNTVSSLVSSVMTELRNLSAQVEIARAEIARMQNPRS